MNGTTNNNYQLRAEELAILSTIAYCDIFSYPVTATEIWKWLYVEKIKNKKLKTCSEQKIKINIRPVIELLENSEKIKNFVNYQDGFYFLRGRADILSIRHRRYLISQTKWRKGRWIIALLRVVPFIRMIAICNKISYDNADHHSDIDFFIVAKPKRIWTARIIITIITSLLRVRRHGRKIKDRACLSFYITEKSLDLQKLANAEPDTHFMYWLTQIAPLFSTTDQDKKFFAANDWVKKYLPNFIAYHGIDFQRHLPDSWLTSRLRVVVEVFLQGRVGEYMEIAAKKIQLRKMARKTASARWQNNTNVVVNDNVLKFHERDARQKCRREFVKKIEQFI